VVRGGELREIDIDANEGKILEDDREDENPSKFPSSKVSLQAMIAKALEKVPGAALEAELELEGGKAVAEIDILNDGRIFEVAVDAETGAVLSVGGGDEEKK
jgi:uncharacterized membrane protein YkoI